MAQDESLGHVDPSHVDRDAVEKRILVVRGYRVLLDRQLARLYGVSTKALNQAVRRNASRFPIDFMFRLTTEEQLAVVGPGELDAGRGGLRVLAHAFTEQGVAMLSSVLRSPRAIAVNIEIMRVFVRLRRWAVEHQELARRMSELEHEFHDRNREHATHIERIYALLDELVEPPEPEKTEWIGFRPAPSDNVVDN